MKLEINNQKITGRIEGLDNLSVTHTRKGEGGSPMVAFSSEIKLYDDGYDLIKAELIDDVDGRLKELSVKLFDDCCDGAIFEGKITGTTIEWCEDDCYISVQLIQNDNTSKQLNCLRSTLIADNSLGFVSSNGVKNGNHPQISYCNEMRPQFLHDIMIIYGVIQEFLFLISSPLFLIISYIKLLFELVSEIAGFIENTLNAVINAIISVVNLIISFINALGAGITPLNPVTLNLNLEGGVEAIEQGLSEILDDAKEFRDTLRALIVGCGRKHPSPLVRSYIDNVCKVCGLNFTSSIFDTNSIYYNLAYLNAPIKKGRSPLNLQNLFGEKPDFGLIEDNLPFLTGVDFLEQIKTVFNADYKIYNDTLVFERKDFFESADIWETQGSLDIIQGICYSWIGDEKQPAAGKFEYAQDISDAVGDEALSRYNEVVSWKGFDNQEGIQETSLLFGAARFRDDGIERDVISYWNAKIALVSNFFSVATDFSYSLLLDKGKTGFPKLILWDGSSLANAKAQRVPVSGYQTYKGLNMPFNLVQNYPMFFDEEKNNVSKNLYEFHKIDDPRLKWIKNRKYDFVATFECSILDDFDITKNIWLTESSVGTMESVVINYSFKTITINGNV